MVGAWNCETALQRRLISSERGLFALYGLETIERKDFKTAERESHKVRIYEVGTPRDARVVFESTRQACRVFKLTQESVRRSRLQSARNGGSPVLHKNQKTQLEYFIEAV